MRRRQQDEQGEQGGEQVEQAEQASKSSKSSKAARREQVEQGASKPSKASKASNWIMPAHRPPSTNGPVSWRKQSTRLSKTSRSCVILKNLSTLRRSNPASATMNGSIACMVSRWPGARTCSGSLTYTAKASVTVCAKCPMTLSMASSAKPSESRPRSPARRWWAMSSTKKVAANRVNGRRSRGPRTGAGKARASRNARRHGLAAFNNKDPAMSGQIKQMVDAICQGDDDPLLRERAVAIAEAQLWLSCIRTEKVAVLERLRDPDEDALTERASRRGQVKRCKKFNLIFPGV